MLTTNPKDKDLGHGVDSEKVKQNKTYLVLPKDELEKGFIRPIRDKYIHTKCGVETKMNMEIAKTYARNPKFYGSTYCVGCEKHLPVSEFKWSNSDEVVGS
jgi:hypothetical protein